MTPRARMAHKIFEEQDYQCQYCGREFVAYQTPLHLHHRIFKSQGGKDDPDNFAACCSWCHNNHGNLKHARTIHEKDDTKINELKKRYSFCRFPSSKKKETDQGLPEPEPNAIDAE